MNRLELDVEQCCGNKRMQPRGGKVVHPLLHHRLHEIRLRRGMDGSSYDDRNAPVHPAIHRLVGKDERMNLEHKPFTDCTFASHGLLKKEKCIAVSYRLQMIL